MATESLQDRIKRIKEEHNAIILAHNYQIEEVQDIADYTADSFELSRKAAETEQTVIVLCGVHFMAESASILAPDKTVLLPEAAAGCPLADMVTPESLRAFKKKYPDAAVAVYINSPASVKAESDICVTSSNAVQVINSLKEERVIFVPDNNLAHFVAQNTDKEIIPWHGYCITHQRVRPADIIEARKIHPHAPVVVHPECPPEVTGMADVALGSGGMIGYARESEAKEFIIGTEMGMIYRLRQACPGKEFYLLAGGLVCPNMKYTNLNSIVSALEKMEHQITVEASVAEKARQALQRMLEAPVK